MGSLNLRRLGYALGAEITGIDLRAPVSDALVSQIRAAWLENIVLCFRAQDLSPQELIAFGRRFGELDDHHLTPHARHPEYPEVMCNTNRPLTIQNKTFKGNVNDTWHTDYSYTDRPTMATLLHNKVLPEIGGNTMFANTYLAYETLSPALRALIDPLEGVHDVRMGTAFGRTSAEVQAERLRLTPLIVHPVVKVHPETGRKALYLGDRVRQFAGMTEEESKPLLTFLNEHSVRYEFVYRHVWGKGDLMMWDNRCALHVAVVDYDRRQPRQNIRCSVLSPKTGYLYHADDRAHATV